MRATRAPRLPGATGLHVVRCSNLASYRRPTEHIGHGARMLTHALLFLPLAATACPIGWTPSPTSATWGQRCYLVPPERSTSIFRCVGLCEERRGTPACIGSAEENALVTTELAAADDLWLGLYQNETGQGPAMGWGRCIAGDAPSFTNWHEGQPDDFGGYQQDCSWLEAATGQWRSLACDGGVHFDPRPWVRTVELSCLCVHGNASVAFADDRKALEAASGYNQRPLTRLTAISYSVATAIALLPSLLLLGRTGWRRLHRGAGAEPGAGIQGATISPSLPARGSTLSTLLSAASSAAVKGVLRAARASAAGRRLRVSFAMGQAGWALLAICLTPVIMFLTAQSIEAAVGDSILWLVPALPSGCLLLLALFPTDVRAIRVVCASLLVLFTALGALCIIATLEGFWPAAHGVPFVALLFADAAALAPTLRCRGDGAMQPRPALRQLWIVYRILCLGLGVLFAGLSIAGFGGRPEAVLSATLLLFAALPTPRNRGRIHRRLGHLGRRGTEAEEAAAIAALVGGSDPDAALKRAVTLFRCLPASRLLASDLTDKMAAPPAGPTLHARTEPAAMGEVTAFLSHSWSDEDEAPGAKHALVSRWAKRRQEATGNEPTLWLVALAPPLSLHLNQYRLHARMKSYALCAAQDKACIDQSNIQQSLACLPVFLAGCQTLLVVAGPTYCSRLWCVMELFTFARSERPLLIRTLLDCARHDDRSHDS